MAIRFFLDHVNYSITGKKRIRTCIKNILSDHSNTEGNINIILTDDVNLQKINKKYLNRDYLTDIIAFDFCEEGEISGDLYISIERVKENADLYNIITQIELLRVIIHGVLHLIGYRDGKKDEKRKMTLMEELYIEKYNKKGPYNP